MARNDLRSKSRQMRLFPKYTELCTGEVASRSKLRLITPTLVWRWRPDVSCHLRLSTTILWRGGFIGQTSMVDMRGACSHVRECPGSARSLTLKSSTGGRGSRQRPALPATVGCVGRMAAVAKDIAGSWLLPTLQG